MTGRVEASFASKLVATIDPNMPVIDSVVLKDLGLRLPPSTATDRQERIVELHRMLVVAFHAFLATDAGRYLVARFRSVYPEAIITQNKMLDLVL